MSSSQRLVFLFAGKYNTSGAKYTTFSTTNINTMPHATAFVVAVTDQYAVYGIGDSNGRFPTLVSDIKTQIHNLAALSKPFYVSFPVVNAVQGYSSTTRAADYQRMKAYALDIKAAINAENAWSLFRGFHWRNERVFDTVSASSPLSNQHVQLMNDVAYVVRSDPNSGILKEFIWSPYLGYNTDYYQITQNLGMVGNRTSIFNTIFLQSNYFFIPSRGLWNGSTRTGIPSQNLALVQDCGEDNVVYNYSSSSVFTGRSVVGGSKTGTTKIAIDIEAQDELKSSSATYCQKYQEECANFGPLFIAGTCPFIFYAGSYNGVIGQGIYRSIDAFYTDGSCVAPA